MRRNSGVQAGALVALFALAAAAFGDDRDALDRAQKLASDRHFTEAERVYREVLERSPHSREAALGLARVVLWEGRYRDARARFLALGDREGAATAAYWQGDFRTAVREFRGIDTPFARESRRAIEEASRGTDRADAIWLDDDQPFRVLRSSITSTFFSDPLTRWDISAGGSTLTAPQLQMRRHLAFATIANETVLPWQRLTIAASAGVQRYPDGSSRPVGGVSLRYRTSPTSSAILTVEQRELLTNATALHTHPSFTRRLIGWTRYADRSWLAGFESGSLRYFDANHGQYAQGYALVPVGVWPRSRAIAFFGGLSAAVRDSAQNRFALEAMSGVPSPAGDFVYAYRGSYTPYWTPKRLHEARAIVMANGTTKRVTWKVQIEGGVAHDTVIGFLPGRGPTPLPSNVLAFTFRRTSHPARAAISFTLPVASRYRFDCGIERSTTAFYAANSIHASLVRHR